MAILRVTGDVVRVDQKNGEKNGRAWRMSIARVLIANQSISEVTLFEDSGVRPDVGDAVDWAVDVNPRGNFLSVQYDGQWSSLESLVTA